MSYIKLFFFFKQKWVQFTLWCYILTWTTKVFLGLFKLILFVVNYCDFSLAFLTT